MPMESKKADSEILSDHEHAEFILVGDGSVTVPTDKATWACTIITSGTKSELIWGLDNANTDIQAAELTAYIKALRLIRSRFRDGSDYKIRVSIVTDSKVIVDEALSRRPGFSTVGMWAEIRAYEDMFDIVWEHRNRNSIKLLKYADAVAKVIRRGHDFLEGIIARDPSTKLEGSK